MYYVISLGVIAIGFTFAAIPAYRMFCEATSFGGLTQVCFLEMSATDRINFDFLGCQRF